MRRLLSVLALALPLAACQLPEPGLEPSPDYPEPLTAWLGTPGIGSSFGDDVEFYVNRPAYVAVFEVVPGRGLSLIYPGFAAQAEQRSSGYHRGTVPFVTGRWFYLTHAGGFDSPRYLLMVASETPLRIQRVMDRPSSLRSDFGFHSFAARNPDVAMDQILNVVLPPDAPDGAGRPTSSWIGAG